MSEVITSTRGPNGRYPKLRIYRLWRHFRTQEKRWEYQGSTTQFLDPDEAREVFCEMYGYDLSIIRAERASTHGYYIED